MLPQGICAFYGRILRTETALPGTAEDAIIDEGGQIGADTTRMDIIVFVGGCVRWGGRNGGVVLCLADMIRRLRLRASIAVECS